MRAEPVPQVPDWAGPALALLERRVSELRADHPAVLVGIDGRSGTGKTVLAGLLAARVSALVVPMDDLYDGWSGLAAGVARACREVVEPLAAGRPAPYRRFDWEAGAPGAWVTLPTGRVVVVEGVGATAGGCAAAYRLRVWLTAPTALRRGRALARDGEVFAPHWGDWARQEDQLFADGRAEAAADVVVRSG